MEGVHWKTFIQITRVIKPFKHWLAKIYFNEFNFMKTPLGSPSI
jgi:hypothetical protein